MESIAAPVQGALGDPCGSPNATSVRREAGTIRAPALPTPSHFMHWNLTFRNNVAGAPGVLDEVFRCPATPLAGSECPFAHDPDA